MLPVSLLRASGLGDHGRLRSDVAELARRQPQHASLVDSRTSYEIHIFQ